MLYRRLADLVVVVHALVALFFLFGASVGRSEPWIALFHFPLALWVCSAYIMGWTCPLTPLENHLRRAAGERGYHGGFVDHYIARPMGFKPEANEAQVPTKSERKGQIILGVAFGFMNLLTYGTSDKYHEFLWPSPKIPSGPVEPFQGSRAAKDRLPGRHSLRSFALGCAVLPFQGKDSTAMSVRRLSRITSCCTRPRESLARMVS